MLDSKLINKGIASFSLGNKATGMDQESYVVFGGVNKTQLASDLVTFKSITDKWWALPFNGIYYGSLQIEKYDVMPDINAIFPYLD
jgi:hypothetical protein